MERWLPPKNSLTAPTGSAPKRGCLREGLRLRAVCDPLVPSQVVELQQLMDLFLEVEDGKAILYQTRAEEEIQTLP